MKVSASAIMAAQLSGSNFLLALMAGPTVPFAYAWLFGMGSAWPSLAFWEDQHWLALASHARTSVGSSLAPTDTDTAGCLLQKRRVLLTTLGEGDGRRSPEQLSKTANWWTDP